MLTILVEELSAIMIVVANDDDATNTATVQEGSARALNEVLHCIVIGVNIFVSTISSQSIAVKNQHNIDIQPSADSAQVYLSSSWDSFEVEVQELFWVCSTWATIPWTLNGDSNMWSDAVKSLQSIAHKVISALMANQKTRKSFIKLLSDGFHSTCNSAVGLVVNSIMINLLNIFRFGLQFRDHGSIEIDIQSISREFIGMLTYSTENNQEILAQSLALLSVCDRDAGARISQPAIDGAYLQSLFRLLRHKYESSKHTSNENPAKLSYFGSGGALRAMGAIVELLYCYVHSGRDDLTQVEVDMAIELCKDILSFIRRAIENVEFDSDLARNYIYYAAFSVVSNLSSRGVLVFPMAVEEFDAAASSQFDRVFNQYLCDTGATLSILSSLLRLIRSQNQEGEAKGPIMNDEKSVSMNTPPLLDARTYAIAIYAVGNIAWSLRRHRVYIADQPTAG